MKIKNLLLLLLISASVYGQNTSFYLTNKGFISFRSDAQQELIGASSSDLRGVVDPNKRMFVFKVLIRTFHGFNSALQQEHFNEKYLESEKYPEAMFYGKIIEDIDLSIDGKYEVRAKGKLTIHGVDVERIIKASVTVENNEINIYSRFTILLSEYNIKVPKVVHEKIANEILVEIKAVLSKKGTIEK